MAESTSSGQPHEESVLSGLDSAPTTSFYWYLALLACVGGFLFGYDTAVIGSVLAFIPYTCPVSRPDILWPERRSGRLWEPWVPGL